MKRLRGLAVVGTLLAAAVGLGFATPAAASPDQLEATYKFVPDHIEPGGSSTLVVTFTNVTSEASPGLLNPRLMTDLPGVQFPQVNNDPAPTDCGPAGALWEFPGYTSKKMILRIGEVPAQSSCAYNIPVSAAAAGVYTLPTTAFFNFPADIVMPTSDATLTVAEVVGVPMVEAKIAGGLVGVVLLVAGGVLWTRRRATEVVR